MQTTTPPAGGDGGPWWRHRMMWLVVGGPAVVVVAAITTAVIAIRGADALAEEPAARSTPVDTADAPAMKARNHAATPATTTATTQPRP